MTNKKYYGYNISHNGYCEVTREHDPEDEWSGEDTYTSWDVGDVLTLTKEGSHPDIASPLKLKSGQKAYLVYLIYSTGDSFSRQEGDSIRFIDVFSTREKAQEVVNIIKKEHEVNKSSYQREKDTYVNEVGDTITLAGDWNGYFESIDVCTVKEVSLNAPKSQSKFKN